MFLAEVLVFCKCTVVQLHPVYIYLHVTANREDYGGHILMNLCDNESVCSQPIAMNYHGAYS